MHEQINTQSKKMLSAETTINKVFSKADYSRHQNHDCGRCGQNGHQSNYVRCPAKSSKCNKCGIIGHFAKKCRSKTTNKRAWPVENGTYDKRRKLNANIRCIEENIQDSEDSDRQSIQTFDCFKIHAEGSNDGDQEIVCSIGGVNTKMIIDL